MICGESLYTCGESLYNCGESLLKCGESLHIPCDILYINMLNYIIWVKTSYNFNNKSQSEFVILAIIVNQIYQ